MKELSYTTRVTVEAPAETVFRFCSDLRNQLLWNPAVRYAVKTTDGPVGAGTRFSARWDRLGEVTVELVEYDPPHSWVAFACAAGLDVTFRGLVVARGSASVYTARAEIEPVGLARLYAPVAVLAMHRQEMRNLLSLRSLLGEVARRDPTVPAVSA